ncbi:hypothetical protein PILCRDRAFT_7288 [Piloderma croceum F 1598]|uniref:Uncharacterized protein n=1 Tax=Piloderma croceum (strain F 1598) TaxID=765440 RepID=A0A0C3C189_PILCF|nr:hypothetical protein PILCRDRAFT_7288 [Piloderma croceum F 1598]
MSQSAYVAHHLLLSDNHFNPKGINNRQFRYNGGIGPYFSLQIPTFDGWAPFRLPDYKDLPKIHTEISPRSAVIVMFTLGAYNLSDGAAMSYGVTVGVSLNIQSVILLAELLKADAPFTLTFTSNAPLHLRVLSKTESSDSEDKTEGTDNDPESQLM